MNRYPEFVLLEEEGGYISTLRSSWGGETYKKVTLSDRRRLVDYANFGIEQEALHDLERQKAKNKRALARKKAKA